SSSPSSDSSPSKSSSPSSRTHGEAEPDKERSDAGADDKDEEEDVSAPLAATQSAPDPSGRPTLTLPVSPQLELLIRKIAAFEALVRRRDYRRAALIAEDTLKAVAAFDPCLYLPSVFAPFFVLLEKHGDKVEPHLPKEEPTGLSARALQFLYRTDLDSFGRKRG
ncbi:MAG TPA: type VI secretion system protein IglI family protein, partial [Pseudomonadota bacterium]|nr:type VI secretion system protein IglI family protein [Pseudomonadota bacterium]